MKRPFALRMLSATDDLHGNVIYTQPGTYSLKLSRRTRAKITAVGSGQDRYYNESWIMSHSAYWYAGNGGAVFIGGVMLPAGIYSISVGDSYHTTYHSDIDNHDHDVSAVSATGLSHNSIGSLLLLTNIETRSANLEVIEGTVEMEGDGALPEYDSNYRPKYGGQSYWNGYGKGSDASESNYTTGYFQLEW